MMINIASLLLLAACMAQPPKGPAAAPAPLDWKTLEAPLLTNHVQITSRDRFVKAGEAYFDHQNPPKWVIFQAVPVPEEGKEPDGFYAMYVARLTRNADGHITGTEDPIKISPDGSANTCGWFHPTQPDRVIFGSTIVPPGNDQKSGFQVGDRKYKWMFPEEMEIVQRDVFQIYREGLLPGDSPLVGKMFTNWAGAAVFNRPNYDAECSYSSDGRFILYARVRDEPTRGRPDADLFIFDTKTSAHIPLITADGYDGGPFFSPDNKWICYRSDRKGNDLLQLFVAELDFGANGAPTGIKREIQITDDSSVNWAPYWHPSGRLLVYGSSAVDPERHSNYEVFAVEVDPAKPQGDLRKRRVTMGSGADVLPVFSDDGTLFMWTAQRGPLAPGEAKPSSQVWVAEVVKGKGGFDDATGFFENPQLQPPKDQKK